MRFRLALALVVSVILIGTASWTRFNTSQQVKSDIIAVAQYDTNNNDYNPEILQDFLGPKTSSSTPSTTPLSKTDLIGRQLLIDYLGLASGGQATEASINALVNRYIESIPTLNQSETISYGDIKTVTNTKANFQNYADKVTAIHRTYTNHIGESYGVNSAVPSGPELYAFAETFRSAYTTATLELRKVPVPSPLVTAHVELVNSYISSATAMEAISGAELDSANAFAGIIILNENLKREKTLLDEISQILTSNGI